MKYIRMTYLVILASILLLASLPAIGPAKAHDEIPLSGTNTVTSSTVVDVEIVNGDTVIRGTFTEDFTGTIMARGIGSFLKVIKPDGSSVTVSTQLFIGTVDGISGTLTVFGSASSDGVTTTGTFRSIIGTGDLINAELEGTFEGPSPGGPFTYSGEVEFDDD